MNPTDVITRAGQLRTDWLARNRQFREWYDILKLKDEMAEDNMESFVSNNPRTFYNLSLHLLTPKPIPHRIPVEGLTDQEIADSSVVEKMLMRVWNKQDRKYRTAGQQSKIRKIVEYILTFGWYAVQTEVDNDGFSMAVWHPYNVFPYWDDEELLEVAHIYTLKNKAAKAFLRKLGGDYAYNFNGDMIVYDYWFLDDNGSVSHAIATSLNTFALQPQTRGDLDRIPVFVGPVGGLPDTGQMDTKWQDNFGESIVAVNASLYRNYNRVRSFLQQAVRDATEPKWFERSTGTEILDEVGLRTRGAIFRGGPNDSVEPLTHPAIPVELSMNISSYEQQIQQGSFSPMMYGNIFVQVAAYAMSQMAQAAQQVLRPYHEAVQDLLADIDNFWLWQIRDHGYEPAGMKFPKLPEEIEVTVDYPISIPGDLINRATVAKMLSPTFELSQDTVMDTLFASEIMDPLHEQAKARKDRAMNSEVAIMLDQVVAYRNAAQRAADNNDSYTARLYTKAADAAEAQLERLSQPAQPVAPTPNQQGGAPLGIEQATTPTTPPGVA